MRDSKCVRIPISEISLGVPFKTDIHDADDLLLISSGHSLTTTLRDRLLKRGATCLEVSAEDARSLLSVLPEGKSESDSYTSKNSVSSPKRAERVIRGQEIPFSEQRQDRSGEPYSTSRAEAFQTQISSCVEQVCDIGHQINDLHSGEVQAMYDLPRELLAMLLEDGDQSIAMMGAGDDIDGIANRCTQMSLLAINMGLEMDFDNDAVELLGKAGLLHDLGLYKLNSSVRDPSAALTDDQRFEYRCHPNLTCDLLDRFNLVSEEVKVLIGQVHERSDGAGYPRGLRANALHPLASVLNLVDSYLSLVHHGPGRPRLNPHDAIGMLLHEGRRGAYGAHEMGAFLRQMTLFPIGSLVRLDDGSEAKVIRRDGDHYATPVVQMHGSDAPVSTRCSDRSITGSIASVEENELRLPVDMLDSVTMESMVAVT